MLQLEMVCSQDLGSCDKHLVDMGTAGMKSKGLVPLRKILAGLCTETQKGCIGPCRGTKCALMQSLELIFMCMSGWAWALTIAPSRLQGHC